MGKTYRRNDDGFKKPKRNNKLNKFDKFDGKNKPKFNKKNLLELNEDEGYA